MANENDRDRDPAKSQPGADAGKETAGDAGDWEARALEQVRRRLEERREEAGEPDAGWETSTLTRLERYFTNRRV